MKTSIPFLVTLDCKSVNIYWSKIVSNKVVEINETHFMTITLFFLHILQFLKWLNKAE
jgi:hypothetical protein